MAKKKSTGKKKSGGTKRRGGRNPWDFEEIGGIAAGVWGGSKLDSLIPSSMTLDPKIIGIGKVVLGEFVKGGKFGQGSLLKGAGYGLQAEGARQLLHEFGMIQGSYGADDDDLVVSIEGIDDEDDDDMGEDVLGEDDDLDTINDDDLDTVNEDVLGDDEDDDDF